MSAVVIDGKAAAEEVFATLKLITDSMRRNNIIPTLYILPNGDPASDVYVRQKVKACKGPVDIIRFDEGEKGTMTEYELINPSDPYTFVAADKEVAALVIGNLSLAFGAETKDEAGRLPYRYFFSGNRLKISKASILEDLGWRGEDEDEV